jgi:hypothetical protein
MNGAEFLEASSVNVALMVVYSRKRAITLPNQLRDESDAEYHERMVFVVPELMQTAEENFPDEALVVALALENICGGDELITCYGRGYFTANRPTISRFRR